MNQAWLIAIIGGIQALLLFIFKTTYAGAVKSKFDESLEGIKAGFAKDINTEIAKLQASLSKQNISHQITTAEYTKYKFDKIISLYINLTNVRKNFDFFYSPPEIYDIIEKEKVTDIFIVIDSCRIKILDASLFFENENLEENITSFLGLCDQGVCSLQQVITYQNVHESIIQGKIVFIEDSSNPQPSLQEAKESYDKNTLNFVSYIEKIEDAFKELKKSLKSELAS